MVNKVGIMNGITLYEDKYLEDNEILQGGTQGIKGKSWWDYPYIIANPKTAKLIYKSFLTKSRKDKLDILNNL